MISTLLSFILGVVILFPFVMMIALLVVLRRMGNAPAQVVGQAADITTFFLFLSVYVISHTIYGEGVGFYIAMIAIVIVIIYAIIERWRIKEFRVKKLLRKVWRLFFLVLAMAYVLLLIVGVILKIVEYVRG